MPDDLPLTEHSRIEELEQENRKNRALLNEYKHAVDISAIVSKTDRKGIITYANDQFVRISGFTREELIGKNHNIIRHPGMPARSFQNLWETIQAKKTWKGVIKNKTKDGKTYVVDSTVVPILDENGEIVEFIAIRRNITNLVRQARRIREHLRDPLTGLPNRTRLMEDIQASSEQLRTIFILNLDHFSEINSFYGYSNGDLVIKGIAENLKKHLDHLFPGMTLYKLPADEFLLSIPGTCPDTELHRICQDLYRIISETHIITNGNVEIHVTGGLGVGSGTGEQPVNNATMALKYARIQKRAYCLYDENIQNRQEANLQWVRILKHAIANNRIIPFYQPIVNNRTEKVEKFESLVRIVDDESGVIQPLSFLSAAKKSKLYPFITKAVVEKVLLLSETLPYDFSINISADDVTDEKTRNLILESIRGKKNGGGKVIFEITESENIENYEEMAEFIARIKESGCQIAIDDFGSGYSNFEYLANLKVDYIKLDGSLIRNLPTDRNLQIITRTIVDFAREMGIKTVAEFIHTREVFEAARSLGIDYSQGYYFGEPMAQVKQ